MGGRRRGGEASPRASTPPFQTIARSSPASSCGFFGPKATREGGKSSVVLTERRREEPSVLAVQLAPSLQCTAATARPPPSLRHANAKGRRRRFPTARRGETPPAAAGEGGKGRREGPAGGGCCCCARISAVAPGPREAQPERGQGFPLHVALRAPLQPPPLAIGQPQAKLRPLVLGQAVSGTKGPARAPCLQRRRHAAGGGAAHP